MKTNSPVLISWVAVKHDPYERNREDEFVRNDDGTFVLGPTLTLLFDERSPYKGRVRNMVLLTEKDQIDPAKRLKGAIREQCSDIKIEEELWEESEDPTDLNAIFEFLRKVIPDIRKRYPERELLIHVSPGTPSMQTIWVLMGATGFVESPFQLVKSLRRHERNNGPAVVPVEDLDIETFIKVYKVATPRQVASEEQDVFWDPRNFSTDTMRALFAEARRFAQIKVPLLLLGERGTGKTSLARWIRSNSPFRKKDLDQGWPAIACGQYTPELLRSELFGHLKGAFTGATQDKEGLLATANGDTLFLDEIGDLSSENQRRLIKALEEKTYYKVGSTKPMKSDFRLLAATNLDTDKLQERLDPDFLDRINYLTLHLPPLREIKDELDWLWPSAYRDAIRRAGVSERRAQFAQQHHDYIVAKLKQHPLPRNMRDLFRVAYRILAARSDTYDLFSPKDAVDYGLEALSGFARPSSEKNISQSVARAFADAEFLDTIVKQVGRLDTKAVERDLKQYMANEIRRIAKDTGQKAKELSDKDDRTLRNWLDSKE